MNFFASCSVVPINELKRLVAGGGFEPPIPLCGIMSRSTTEPFRIKPGLCKKSCATLLRFQLNLAFSSRSVIRMLLTENQSPRSIALAPALKMSCVMLFFSGRWIVAYSNVEARTGKTPEHVNEVRFLGNSRHSMEGWLRGVDLNHRPLGYEPNELPDCSTPHFNNNRRAAFG